MKDSEQDEINNSPEDDVDEYTRLSEPFHEAYEYLSSCDEDNELFIIVIKHQNKTMKIMIDSLEIIHFPNHMTL